MKLRKTVLSLLLAAALMLGLGVPVLADSTKDVTIYFRGIEIVVNGTRILPTDAAGKVVEPFILDGTTYLPVRAVAGALGLEVGWDDATSTITLTSPETPVSGTPAADGSLSHTGLSSRSAQLTYRGIQIVVDGAAVTPKDATGKTVEPFIMDGTTYLPVRAVANALGLDVGWDDATSTVTLGEAEQGIWVLTKTTNTYSFSDGSSQQDVTAYTYDAKGNVLTERFDGSGDADDWYFYAYTYDAKGNVLTERYENPAYTCSYTYTYDASGNRVREQYESSYYAYDCTYTYDARGNLLRDHTVYDDGDTFETVYTYDSHDNITSINENGYITTWVYTYDAAGRVVKEVYTYEENKYITAYVYDAQGNVVKETRTFSDGSSGVYTYAYDADNKLIKEEHLYDDGESYLCTYTYDSEGFWLGSFSSYSDGSWDSFTYVYENGHPVSSTLTDSFGGMTVCTFEYDANGNMVRETDVYDSGYIVVTVNEYKYLPLG